MDRREPKVGLITDTDLNRHLIQAVLSEYRYRVVNCIDASSGGIVVADTKPVDAWLIDVCEDHIDDVIHQVVEFSGAPFLMNDEIPPIADYDAHQQWRRRLIQKMAEVAIPVIGDTVPVVSPKELPDSIWVLAASLGGPDAVKRFISHLPPGLPIAMIYAQHIEQNFDGHLVQTVGRDQAYVLRLIKGEYQLAPGEVGIVPVDHQLRFLPHGRVVELREQWQGPYQPAIDQVIAELARQYRDKLGVIVFSGMCNDGELGCRVAKACGSKVWAQSPESCASAAMVEAALSTGAVSYQGSPEELAESLTHYVHSQQREKNRIEQRETRL